MVASREICSAIESVGDVLSADSRLHVFRALLDVLDTAEIMRVSRLTRDPDAIRLIQRALNDRNAEHQAALQCRLGE